MATPILCRGCGQVHDPLRACPKPQPVCPECLRRAKRNREIQRDFRKRVKAKEELEAKCKGMTVKEYRESTKEK